MSRALYLTQASELRISSWLISHLNKFIHLLPVQKLAIGLTVTGDDATQELLSAYAEGVRHFSGSNLVGAELSFLQLPQIVLIGANLSKVDFWATNLANADLRYADLSGAELMCANLTGANLTGANLSEASLMGTNLTDAVLCNACLRDSNLSRTKLQNAELTNADFQGTITNNTCHDF